MITNLDQLKNMIQYCKENKIKKLKVKDIEFEISELDFLPESSKQFESPQFNTGEYNTETLADTLEEEKDWRDDPDLYHLSNT